MDRFESTIKEARRCKPCGNRDDHRRAQEAERAIDREDLALCEVPLLLVYASNLEAEVERLGAELKEANERIDEIETEAIEHGLHD